MRLERALSGAERTVVQVLVGLRPKQLASIDAIRKDMGVSRSSIVRAAVELWLNYGAREKYERTHRNKSVN